MAYQTCVSVAICTCNLLALTPGIGGQNKCFKTTELQSSDILLAIKK